MEKYIIFIVVSTKTCICACILHTGKTPLRNLLTLAFCRQETISLVSNDKRPPASRKKRKKEKQLQTEQLSQEEAKRVTKDNKASYTLVIILGVLVITYMPAIILLLVGATSLFNKLNTGINLICFTWASTCVLLRSLFNPIIYCWRIATIRCALLEIFHVRQPENRARDVQMVAIQHQRLQIQHTCRETWSTAERKQEPILLSMRDLKVDEIVHMEEMDT